MIKTFIYAYIRPMDIITFTVLDIFLLRFLKTSLYEINYGYFVYFISLSRVEQDNTYMIRNVNIIFWSSWHQN